MTNLILGCGYLGHRVALAWRQQEDRVFVVTRSADRARQFAAEGLEPIVADITDPKTIPPLPEVRTVLFSVGYDRQQLQPIGDVYAGGLKHVLGVLSPDTGRVIYISSTGVYGDEGGDWVDEKTVAEPSREGGRACLAAESVLSEHPLGKNGIVLRLAGIYGPARIPRLDDLRAGKPIRGDGDGFLNLIHVDDAVQAILAAATCEASSRIYNICDGNPAPRRAFYEELAGLIGTPPPQFISAGNEAPERSRGGADKRVSNRRMLAELAVTLRYPTFREGLAAIVRAG